MRRIGLDLALRAPHRAMIYDDDQPVGRSFAVERSKAGIDELVRRASRDGAVCEFIMEPTGFAWLPIAAELARRGHRTYVPKPQKTFALRKFLKEHTKTDGTDARAAALLRHVDCDGVHELRIPSSDQTSLQLFVKQRARFVADAGKSKQRIHAVLVLAHPLLSESLGSSLFAKVGRALLRRHLDPFRTCARGRARLQQFWNHHGHDSGDAETFGRVWSACEATYALFAELHKEQRLPFDYSEIQQIVNQELDAIEFIEKQVKTLEAKIRRLYRIVDPDQVLLEVPGVGETIGAALQAVIGDINRFPNVKSFAAYTGLVPRTNLTAGEGKPGQRMTKAGSDLIKQYLFLAAEIARQRDPELAATYAHAIARGKHHYTAIVIVAHKLARRIYAVLKLHAEVPSEAHYRLRRPDDGIELSKKEALDHVRTFYPSKAERARKAKAAQAVPAETGSSEDATNGISTAPPMTPLPMTHACGKPDDQPVVNP